MDQKMNVLIAGIGGASLGTEILKCLTMIKRYNIFGCDISKLAYGHYQEGFSKTFVIDRKNYINSLIKLCEDENIKYIIPGGEEPMVLLNGARESLVKEGLCLVGNSAEIINIFSDKLETFKKLSELGFQIPVTKFITTHEQLDEIPFPCIIKPSQGSGGSSFVFLACDKDEALIYIDYLTKNGKIAMVQEYIPDDEGEFTVGVLSIPTGDIVGSIALKRIFTSKLSVSVKGKSGLISSGYSQGLIDDFLDVRRTAENIAKKINSNGPLNIQGRVKNGIFIPFEINPRFSASTYLRAMAGFNEIDIYLQFLITGKTVESCQIKPGYYLRSLSETFVKKEECKL